MSQEVVFASFRYGLEADRRLSRDLPNLNPPEPAGASALEQPQRPGPGAAPLTAAQRDRRLAALVHENYSLLWRTLRRVGIAEAEIDDALQEVFLVAARKLCDIGEARERAFLAGVAIRVASTRRRSLRRRRDRVDDAIAEQADPTPTPDELTDRKRARALLDEILASMGLKFRAVFVLFELEGLEIPEIAELLEIPVGTVGSRLRRARDLFHKAVARHQASSLLPGGKP